MSTIQDLFQQAQLAEAAYADFTGMGIATQGQAIIDALTTGESKFSTAQATAFVTQWEVVDHLPNMISGFSATIFRDRQTGA